MSVSPIRLTDLAHGGGCGCKLAPSVLQQLLANQPAAAPFAQLLVGTETGDDAAVWQVDDKTCVIATTDFFMPVVDDPFDFGRIAAANALSDVYAMGGKPIMALAILGMPLGKLPLETVSKILQGGASICAEAGIPVAGGHSIDSVEPIYGLAVIGLCAPENVRRNSGARLGDVHGITDVTGFGLLGHGLELARGGGVRLNIEQARIPFLTRAEALAEAGYITGASGRNWDSYGAQAVLPPGLPAWRRALLTDPQTSGGLLVACKADRAESIRAMIEAAGYPRASIIGSVSSGEPAVQIV
jgi:selenide,water dikinase